MFVNVYKLKNNCPNEVEEDIKEIVLLSKKFLDNLDIYPNQDLGEVRIEVQEGRDILLQIISRFLTLISNQLEEPKEIKEIGFKLKFEEDMGNVISELNSKSPGKIDKLVGVTSILNFVGDLRTIYVFIIYDPIMTANRYYRKDLQKYIRNIFKIIRVNAGILGASSKVFSPTKISKTLIPKPAALIKSEGKKEDSPISEEEMSNLDLFPLNLDEGEIEDEDMENN